MKRFFIAFLLCLLSLPLILSVAYAQVPPNIQQAAQQSLREFIPTLNQESDHYGLTSTDPVENATLGEGYPYLKVSVSALKAYEKGKVPTLSELYIPSGGYIFPIHVGDKPVGIAYVENFQGKWQVVQISSNLTFESDLALVKESIKQKLALDNIPSNTELIYDQSFQIAALQVHGTNGEFVMPLRNNYSLGLKKDELQPVKDHIEKLDSVYKAKVSNGPETSTGLGTLNVQNETNSSIWLEIVLALSIGVGAVFIVLKKFVLKTGR